MNYRITRFMLLFIFSLMAVGVTTGADFPNGKITPKVQCQDQRFSYALYLPSNYDTEKKWPVLFCFNARAHGVLPVELFQIAAEKYGWVIVSSNESGSDDASIPNLQAMKAMYEDVSAKFSVDDRRLYATGFSGGARIACDMGYIYAGKVAGVIGCGAGFPTDRVPSADTPFAYFGTVGNLDFNHYEMQILSSQLKEAKVPYFIRVFNGGHQWPPREVCTEAIEWMEARAMKDGRKTKNDELIGSLLSTRRAKAAELESSGNILEAHDAYSSIVSDFESLADTTSESAKVLQIAGTEGFKSAAAVMQKRNQESAEFRQKFASVIQSIRNDADELPSIQKIEAFLDLPGLKKIAADKKDTPEGQHAQRLLEAVYVQTVYYMPRNFMEYGDYPKAALVLDVAAGIHPEDPDVWYNLACAHSLSGDKKKAIDALKSAVKYGFKDAAKIESDFDLKDIREEKEFRKIVEKLKKG